MIHVLVVCFLSQSLRKAFHCNKPTDRRIKLVPLLASFTTFEVFFNLEGDDITTKESSDSIDTSAEQVLFNSSLYTKVDNSCCGVSGTVHFNQLVVEQYVNEEFEFE